MLITQSRQRDDRQNSSATQSPHRRSLPTEPVTLSPFNPAEPAPPDPIGDFLAALPWSALTNSPLARITPTGAHMFQIVPQGGVRTPILRADHDIIAWSPRFPARWRFWTGDGRWLGLLGPPAREIILAANPAEWVASGCRGACALRNDALLDLFPHVDLVTVADEDYAGTVKYVFAAARVTVPRVEVGR